MKNGPSSTANSENGVNPMWMRKNQKTSQCKSPYVERSDNLQQPFGKPNIGGQIKIKSMEDFSYHEIVFVFNFD